MAQKSMTKTDYDGRKAALADALEGAQIRYRKTAYEEEIGEAPAGSAAEALGGVKEVEGKILVLESAWTESQRLAGEKFAEDDRRARRLALSKVDRLLAKRSEAIAGIEKLLVGLGDHVRRFNEAGEAIIEEIRPHRAHLGNDVDPNRALGDFMTTVRDKTDLKLIGGILYDFGVDLSLINMRDSWFGLRDRGFAEVVGGRNRTIRRIAETIAPPPPKSFAEAMASATAEPTILGEA